MESLILTMKRRIEDAIKALNDVKLLINVIQTLEKDSNGFFIIKEEEYIYEYLSNVLIKYITSLCQGREYINDEISSDRIEETVESQALVEYDCINILSKRLSIILMGESEIITEVYIQRTEKLKKEDINGEYDTDIIKLEGDYFIIVNEHGRTVLEKLKLLFSKSEVLVDNHVNYLSRHLSLTGDCKILKLDYLSASRPWIVYWTLHSLNILGIDIEIYKERAINTLQLCWDEEYGGYGGGYGQRGHIATSYAAIATFKMLNSIDLIHVTKFERFLQMLKNDNGTFNAHLYGEADTRSTYCAIACASMLNILTLELSHNTVNWIVRCQTYEGGISSEPGLEAHAGYTYCGTATLNLLNSLSCIDTNKLYQWSLDRFTPQFGFQGRPHKLVDVCYSFWIGATIRILREHSEDKNEYLMDDLLSIYILELSQTMFGFQDKPYRKSDLYHTCYALSYLNTSKYITTNNKQHDININILI